MVSVFNVEPYDIRINDNINIVNYDFDFLDLLLKHDIPPDNYYRILNSQEDFKFKNIYNFIFLRINKINKIYEKINTIQKLDVNIKKEYFNNFFKSYIGKDEIKMIIVINSIQVYFFPKLRDG
jgi:hypothetical protein